MRLMYTHYFYVIILILSIGGLLLADRRLRLAFWHNKIASTKAVGYTMLLLLIFDVAGVINKIFSTNQDYVVRINIISPNIPIEEIIFLFMLCYVTLILYQLIGRLEVFRKVDNNKRKNDKLTLSHPTRNVGSRNKRS